MPRQPSIIAMIQNSTIMVRNGSWRPTIWPMAKLSIPVTAGDQNRDAHRTEGHRRGVDDQAQASRIQRVKPETNQQRGGNRHRCAETRRPSRKAPNEKPTISICRRWSGVIDRIDERMMSNCPVFTEIL